MVFKNYLLLYLVPILLLFKNVPVVYTLTCPSSHPTYISGWGCTNNNNQINTAFCGPTSAEYSLAGIVRVSQGSEPVCQSGEAVVRSSTMSFSTNLALYSCIGGDIYTLAFYYLVGGCLAGDSSTYQYTVTTSPTLRYINAITCANFDLASTYIEASSSSTPSADLNNKCYGLSIVKTVSYDLLSAFTCPIGYGGPFPCSEIDECSAGTHGCISPATCQNTDGGYQCNCPSGYNKNGNGCTDIDECSLGTHGCISPATCQNTIGGYQCNCPSGYSKNGNGCSDIDECSAGTHGCISPATCQNTIGGYQCNCPNGYNKNGNGCTDIDECSAGTHGCISPATCQNTNGGYQCNCPSGYNKNGNGCSDIDECSLGNHGCISPATCQNSIGSFSCLCNIQGYELDSTKKKCVDKNECTGANKCIGLSKCLNKDGTYECTCDENYHLISNGTDCAQDSDILISSFKQKSNSFYSFILEGKRLPSSSTTTIKIGTIDCNYISGNDTFIECSTAKGLEVIGEVLVQDIEKASNVFQFVGAPFITSYSPKPSTEGSSITFTGRNLPTGDNVSLKINSIECPITESNINQIVCNVPEGSGVNNQLELSNQLVSNTDATTIKYSNPIIESTSQVFTNGGILTINGSNFGNSGSRVSINIGKNKCQEVQVKSHHELTCKLGPTNEYYSQIIDLVVDGLSVENDYYFTYSVLESGECESNCNGNGKCTSNGCLCDFGFSGLACNETSGEIITTPPLQDKPIVDIKDPNLADYGYRVSIVRIEELDLLENTISSFDLLKLDWSLDSTIKDKWIYNITLPNQSSLECTFEYFKSSTNITFASTVIQVPNESLKLSIKTQHWSFTSKLNSLRIVIETNTTLLLNTSKECSINQSPNTYYYNQHLWVTSENSESGIISRFVKYASIDNDKQIFANVKPLNQLNKFSTLIGVSLPYFNSVAIIDPDFSTLLNVQSNKNIGNCKSSSKSSWRIATGASIGAAIGVSLIGISAYFLKVKRNEISLLNRLKNINNQQQQ